MIKAASMLTVVPDRSFLGLGVQLAALQAIEVRKQCRQQSCMQVPGLLVQVNVQKFETVYKCFHRIPNDGVLPVGVCVIKRSCCRFVLLQLGAIRA